MAYSWEISQRYPTCFVFLIDQSESMLKPIGGLNRSKAEVVAESVNHLLYNLVLRCVKGAEVLDRFHVAVIGYGSRVGSAFSGDLAGNDLVTISQIASYPLRVDERTQEHPDGSVSSVNYPVWFEPLGDGKTPMCAAFTRASNILAGFLVNQPECFPPIVINITDGKPTDGNAAEVSALAARLRQMTSEDGNVLLFNVHVSERTASPIEFPDSEAGLPDVYAKFLFRISSTLPPPMIREARQLGMKAGPNTRGFVFNADISAVVRSLDIGTRVGLPTTRA